MSNLDQENEKIVLVDDRAYIGNDTTYLEAMGVAKNNITAITSLKTGIDWLEHPDLHPNNAAVFVNDDLADGWGSQFLDAMNKTESPLRNAKTIVLSGRQIDLENSPYKNFPQIVGVLQKPFTATALRKFLTHPEPDLT